MSADVINWIWFFGGILLIAAEIQIPHFYSGFFGIAALIVAVLRWLHLLESLEISLIAWAVISIVLLLSFRRMVVNRLSPEISVQSTDEDLEAIGEIVEVVTTISPADSTGRIRFRGTTWPAVSSGKTIPAGTRARILYRDNLIWKVEEFSDPEKSDDEKLSPPLIKSGEK